MNVLITGSCGFIGYHLSRRLLKEGHTVTGFDAMTAYYDPDLKRARLAGLRTHNGFSFAEARLEDDGALEAAVERFPPELIIHLAAQPGVRYSLENPKAYIDSNIIGSWRVMELARQLKPRHLMIASTSSIYGANPKIPFSEADRAVPRARIMREVWGENWFGPTKTLDTHIGWLRQKLADAGAPDAIVTLRGIGYRLESSPAAGSSNVNVVDGAEAS